MRLEKKKAKWWILSGIKFHTQCLQSQSLSISTFDSNHISVFESNWNFQMNAIKLNLLEHKNLQIIMYAYTHTYREKIHVQQVTPRVEVLIYQYANSSLFPASLNDCTDKRCESWNITLIYCVAGIASFFLCKRTLGLHYRFFSNCICAFIFVNCYEQLCPNNWMFWIQWEIPNCHLVSIDLDQSRTVQRNEFLNLKSDK